MLAPFSQSATAARAGAAIVERTKQQARSSIRRRREQRYVMEGESKVWGLEVFIKKAKGIDCMDLLTFHKLE